MVFSRIFSKAVAGVVGNSSALVADAVHSLGDLVSDFVTLYTHRLSRSPAGDSRTYPYGLGKFEALGTFIVSLLLVSSGIGIAWHSAGDLLGTKHDLSLASKVLGSLTSLLFFCL
jgi:divalent metal cation (Fe/Co/Zn/Cd) transporter